MRPRAVVFLAELLPGMLLAALRAVLRVVLGEPHYHRRWSGVDAYHPVVPARLQNSMQSWKLDCAITLKPVEPRGLW